MPAHSSRQPARALVNPNDIQPGEIVWLDSKHLTPTRGAGVHTWPHSAICLYHYYQNSALPELIVTGTVFQFVCISSITRNNPLDLSRQIRLDHHEPNTGLTQPSAACVDFAPNVVVTVEGQRHVLEGVRRLTIPVVRRISTADLRAVLKLFNEYWSAKAKQRRPNQP